MRSQKEQVLNGSNNKRLNNTDALNNEATAAWAGVEEVMPESQVGIPSETNVVDAKDWVDDESKL